LVLLTKFYYSDEVQEGEMGRECGMDVVEGKGIWGSGGENQSKEIVVNGQIMLKLILKKQDWRVWTGLNWLKLRTVGELL